MGIEVDGEWEMVTDARGFLFIDRETGEKYSPNAALEEMERRYVRKKYANLQCDRTSRGCQSSLDMV